MLNISKLKSNKINNNLLINKGLLNNDIRHHPSSTKEWFNSIYNFYKKNEINIPHLDLIVHKIIKNYFNMYSSRLERSIFLRKITLKKRRYNLNNILISKPELKHTNDKVKIVVYVFNKQLSNINIKMNNLKKRVFAQYFYKVFTSKYITMSKIHNIKSLLRRAKILKSNLKNLIKFRESFINRFKSNKYNGYLIASKAIENCYNESLKIKNERWNKRRSLKIAYTLFRIPKKGKIIQKLILKKLRKRLIKEKNESIRQNILNKLNDIKVLNKSIKIVRFLSTLLKVLNNKILKNTIDFYYEHMENMPIFSITRKVYIKRLKKRVYRLRLLLRYNRMMAFNKFKFNSYLSPLRIFLEKVYKKDVTFDIVTIKNYRLNSSILAQIIAIKLRNRKNRINRILNRVIRPMVLPKHKRYQYFLDIPRNKFLQNTILKHNINKVFIYKRPLGMNIVNKNVITKNIKLKKLSYTRYEQDNLDMLLKSIYLGQKTIINSNVIENVNSNKVKQLTDKLLINRNLENVVLDSIKNKTISGIRLQGWGRLSKRAIASRSVSKIIQKGLMKDINSSYKRWSSILLKGNLNANVQFTKTNDKTRIGSFGLKGWISSM